MINRVLIRIRVIQILYATYLNESGNLKKSESDLVYSLQKSYDLYYYLLLLLVEITDAYKKRIDTRRAKLLPSEQDINPNTKLIDNLFIDQLRNTDSFTAYLSERPLSWDEYDVFIKNLLDKILKSSLYEEYSSNSTSDYQQDKDFWKKVFKSIICNEEQLVDILEDESLYWNDDVEIVESFVIKTIKLFDYDKGNSQELLPMFKDDEDRIFATTLLRESMLNVKMARDLIDKYASNWESDRIAFMDRVIMQAAITEIVSFPSIPVSVTLNEYINISKSYSTQKSFLFINGILDSIVNELKNDKKLIKK